MTIDRDAIVAAALARYPLDERTGRYVTEPVAGEGGAPELPLDAGVTARVDEYVRGGVPGLRIVLYREVDGVSQYRSINAVGPAADLESGGWIGAGPSEAQPGRARR